MSDERWRDTYDLWKTRSDRDEHPDSEPEPDEEEETMTAVVPQEPATSLMEFVRTAVTDRNVDVSKLKALLDIQRELIADDAKAQFNRALHDAQAEIPHIAKQGTVELGQGKGSYKFATWEDMDKVLRPIMDRHGFTLTFDMATKEGGGAVITGTLLHVAGHSKSAAIPLALDTGPGRNNLQAMGSTMSYGRRYVAEMLFNVVRKGADDDGKLGGTKFVTIEQAAEIDTLLRETKTDAAKFLQMFEAADVRNLTADQFAPARNMLYAKRKRAP